MDVGNMQKCICCNRKRTDLNSQKKMAFRSFMTLNKLLNFPEIWSVKNKDSKWLIHSSEMVVRSE